MIKKIIISPIINCINYNKTNLSKTYELPRQSLRKQGSPPVRIGRCRRSRRYRLVTHFLIPVSSRTTTSKTNTQYKHTKILNPHLTSTCKYKNSRLLSICKTLLSKTSKRFLSSHLTPPKRKSSSSLKISKRTEKPTTIKKETKILTSILE